HHDNIVLGVPPLLGGGRGGKGHGAERGRGGGNGTDAARLQESSPRYAQTGICFVSRLGHEQSSSRCMLEIINRALERTERVWRRPPFGLPCEARDRDASS